MHNESCRICHLLYKLCTKYAELYIKLLKIWLKNQKSVPQKSNKATISPTTCGAFSFFASSPKSFAKRIIIARSLKTSIFINSPQALLHTLYIVFCGENRPHKKISGFFFHSFRFVCCSIFKIPFASFAERLSIISQAFQFVKYFFKSF